LANTWKIGDLRLVHVVLLPSATYLVRHVMKPMSLLALSMLPFLGGCPFGPGSQPPPPDDCSSPGALDGIEAIEVGTIDPSTDAFVPWQDDANVYLTHGAQGGTMIGVVLSLRGSELPACMRHTMELRGRFNDTVMARTDYPVRTYPARDGTRVTTTVWLIFSDYYPDQGDQVSLALQVGDLEVSRALLIEAPVPYYLGIPENTLSAGGLYPLEIGFDRPVYSIVNVTVESSDPAVVRPTQPTFQVPTDYDALAVTELEAVAPGGPVTISVTANGETLTTELWVSSAEGQ
jgi:hypothetical protein